ncbi:MAG: soluble lytic murein transglycosylase [Polaribacter sp.]|jgi:soluble lytic murein transglycosylase
MIILTRQINRQNLSHLTQVFAYRIIGWFLCLTFCIYLLFLSSAAYSSHNQHQNFSIQQANFLEAEKALKHSNSKIFRTKVAELGNYPLKSYLRRDYLISKWSSKPDNIALQNNVIYFINKNTNDVVSRKIRSRWLNYLADNNKADQFINYYQPGYGKKLDCKNAEFKLIQMVNKKAPSQKELNNDLLTQVESLWLVGASLPKSCDGMIKQWKYFSYPNQNQLEQRIILAIKNKQIRLARYLAKQINKLNPTYNAPQILFESSPLKYFNNKSLNDNLSHQILASALIKLAWSNPSKAITYWQKNSDKLQFDKTQSLKLKRAIALSLSIDGESYAKNWLESLNANTDPSVNQWLLSVAIDEQDWDLIEHLARLKNKNSLDADKWRYWRAIAVKRLGHKNAAIRLFANLAKQRSYYGFLASKEVKQPSQLNNIQHEIDKQQYAKLAQSDEAKRAYEFFQLGRLNLARSEWNNLKSKTSKSHLVTLAQIAHDWGWDHQSILAFAKSQRIDDIDKRFPLYKLSKYESESEQHQIPLSWAYAITRQESAFKVDAISSAGAKGLMQLTHNTAKHVYRKNKKTTHHPYSNSKQLLEPDTNIELGVAHLGELLKAFNGHLILATAAYNAGSHRVEQWLLDNAVSDPILWIEQIPFKETREYVKNVLTYQEIYSQLTDSDDSFITKMSHFPIPTMSQTHASIASH